MGLSPSLCGAISMLRCSPATQSQSSVALSHTHSFLVRLLMDEAVASCSDLSRSRIEVCVCVDVCVYMRPRSGSERGGPKSGEEWYVLLQCQQRLLHTREKAARRAQPFEQSESGDPAAAERFCQCSDDPMHSRAKRWLSSETQLQRKR